MNKIILKILATILAFCFISFSCAAANDLKQTKDGSSIKSEIEDPDLKLPIEELKKKYPISLLDKKKKAYKAGQKVDIKNYSVEEIKAAFLNADKNFKDKKTTKRLIKEGNKEFTISDEEITVYDQQEIAIIEATCDKLGTAYYPLKLTKPHIILQSFIFSTNGIRVSTYPYISNKALDCLSINDPLGTEDRN